MIRQIAPQFFTTDIPATLAYYKDKLGFECQSTWHDPPVYAIVTRDGHAIHFRCAEPPTPNPDKYSDELLDAYLSIDDVDALYSEYSAQGVEFTRPLGDTPWNVREFVVKDCDGRLLAFGATFPPIPDVNLPRHLDRAVEGGIESGRFSNTSEVIREALRLLEQRQAEDRAKIE
jgi:uncharacterized glyoxalase superfamily protein PhnB